MNAPNAIIKTVQAAILMGLAAFSLSACGGDSVPTPTVLPPTEAQTATSTLITSPEQIIITADPNLLVVSATPTVYIPRRMTLPPSYTPTRTPSITPTRTPSAMPTETHTPSPTATMSVTELCSEDNFIVGLVISPERVYEFSDEINYFLYTRYAETVIIFEAENLDTGTTFSYSVPGGWPVMAETFGALFEETGSGTYDYSFELDTYTEQDICPPVTGQITFGTRSAATNAPTFLDQIIGGEDQPEATDEP